MTDENPRELWNLTRLGKPLRRLSLVLALCIPILFGISISTGPPSEAKVFLAVLGFVFVPLLSGILITIYVLINKTKHAGIIVAIFVYTAFFLFLISIIF